MDMRLDEVAAFIGKSVAQTRRYMESGLLTPHKAGKHLLFDREQVIAFAQARGLRTAEPPDKALTVATFGEPDEQKAEIIYSLMAGQVQRVRDGQTTPTQAVNVVLAASGVMLRAG